MGALGRSGRGWHEPQAQPHWLPLLAPSPSCPLPRGRGEGALSGHREVGTAQGSLRRLPVPAARTCGAREAGVRTGGAGGSLWLRALLGAHQLPAAHPGPSGVRTSSVVSPLQRRACGHWAQPRQGVHDALRLPCRGPVGTRRRDALGRTGCVCGVAYGGGPGPRGSVWGRLESCPHGTQPPPPNSKAL